MPITLTTTFTLPNGARMEFPKWRFDDDSEIWTVPFELRTTVPTNRRLITAGILFITNGTCSLLSRNASPAVGLNIDDFAHYFVQTARQVATGYTDARAVERGAANTPAARRTALEAHLFSAGHIDSSLAGT